MIQKPTQFTAANAEAFRDRSVAEAYYARPPYPGEVFEILAGLIHGAPRRVLDVGCGTGNIARYLIARVEQLDAVDSSRYMIEHGRRLPHGDHPRLRWLYGRVEDVALSPPYALVVAAESLHWMDWTIVLPRFRDVLLPGGYLAIVEQRTVPDPWSTLGELIPRYRTDGGYRPYNMVAELERHGLFQKVGEQATTAIRFVQGVDDYVESYHSRSGFSRERMGRTQAAAFDEEARCILLRSHPDGTIPLDVTGTIVWGFPASLRNKPQT